MMKLSLALPDARPLPSTFLQYE